MFPDSRLLKTKIFPDKENPQTLCACVGKFLALVWNFFIVHEDNIIYLSSDIKISGFLNLSDTCLKVSSICLEIWIVHIDCDIFYPMTKNFQIAQTLLRVSGNLLRVFEKFQIDTNFWSVSWNFQHLSKNYNHKKILNLFSIQWQNNFPDWLKFLACVWKLSA